MASPQSTTSHDGGSVPKKNLEQITFRFCSECSNMLYPKEDPDNHKLQFTCRTCQYSEEANSTCVFRNVLNNAAGETAGVTQDVGSDPTVGEPLVEPDDDSPKTFVCLCCGNVVMCGICGTVPASHVPPSPSIKIEFPETYTFDGPSGGSSESPSDSPMILDFAEFSDDYDFMDEDYDNGDDDLEQEEQLPRSNKTCPVCKHEEAVFFQSQQRSAETGMKLFYVCCDCGNIFQ